MLGGDDLRDHAAHRRADDMGGADAQSVHQPDRVARHVVEGVGRPHRQMEEGARHHPARPEAAGRRHPGRQADVAIVEAHDPEAAGGQALAERIRPGHELHAEAHDEQDRRGVRRPELLVLDGDPVRLDRAHRLPFPLAGARP